MKFRSLLLFACLAFVPGLTTKGAFAQDNPDNNAHITPRATPTPTPSPKKTQQQSPDQYERPPFPGDAPGTQPAPDRQDGYERPPCPGDAHRTGAPGESSSRDSEIDLSAKPVPEPARK